MKNKILFVAIIGIFGQASSSTFVSLSKRDALDFLSSSKSIETKHSTQDKEFCVTSESFCESNQAFCKTEEVYERRCSDCSFFQTCDIDFSVYCLHGTRNDCIGLEAFDLGKGTFAFLLILTFICIALIITLVVFGVRKYRRRKNKAKSRVKRENHELRAGTSIQNTRVHPQVNMSQNPGLVQLQPIQPADYPPAYTGPTLEQPRIKKDSNRKTKGSSGNNVQGSIQPAFNQSTQQNYQNLGLPLNTQVMPPAQSTLTNATEQRQGQEKGEHSPHMAFPSVLDPSASCVPTNKPPQLQTLPMVTEQQKWAVRTENEYPNDGIHDDGDYSSDSD